LSSQSHHFYQIAGLTVRVESDLPITGETFHPKFRFFRADSPGDDLIIIRHHFELPMLEGPEHGKERYRKLPWLIFEGEDRDLYQCIAEDINEPRIDRVAIFNKKYSRGDVYSDGPDVFLAGNLMSLSLLTTDQIWLSRALADRNAFFVHSSGAKIRERGFLFMGHSEAGKSTIARMLQDRSEILCDDRIIVRRWPDGFRIHGTWSHGEISTVSGAGAPLAAAFILKKSFQNRISRIRNRRVILSGLLACLIKPLCTAEWWNQALEAINRMTREVPCYELEFDRSGKIADILEQLPDLQ
jgi:hypothetical protein